jgi:hypothetical protein
MIIDPLSTISRHAARLRHFAGDDRGAVTVDWVVLTAAIVGLGIAVIGFAGTGMITLGQNMGTSLSDTDIVSLDGPGAGLAPDEAEDADAVVEAGAPDDTAVEETESEDLMPIRVIERGPGGRVVGAR